MANIFHGTICEHHPDLDGRRYYTGRCTGCASATTAAKMRERREVIRHSRENRPEEYEVLRYYEGKICDYHPELLGKRDYVTKKCVVCIKEKNREKAKRRKLRRAGMSPAEIAAARCIGHIFPELQPKLCVRCGIPIARALPPKGE